MRGSAPAVLVLVTVGAYSRPVYRGNMDLMARRDFGAEKWWQLLCGVEESNSGRCLD
jgi:hypothetical protein